VLGVLLAGWSPAASAAEPGLLRFAHLSPDTPAVDVSVARAGSTAGTVIRHAGYGSVSGWHHLAPGTYAVALRAAGSPVTTPPVLSALVDVRPGAARTVAAVGRFDALTLRVRDEDLRPPPSGRARVRVVDAATAAPLDVSLPGGRALARSLPFEGTSGWADVPAGPSSVHVGAAGHPGARVALTFAPGSVSTLLVLDRPGGGLTVRQVVDAGAPAVVPVGPVPAGGGGTAGSPLPAAALGGAAAAGAALLLGSRRTAPTLLATTALLAGIVPPARPAAAAAARPPAASPSVVAAGPAPARGPAPVRLLVPAAGIDTPLPPLRVDAGGALVPPDDVATAGWFSQGPAPGEAGPAVLVGHVDSTAGPGVFFRLRSLHPGDGVVVRRADGSAVRFTVTRVARYPKTAFPTAAVYGPTPDAELRLVTCGGAFDHAARSYLDNVVVYADAG
jgi:hypothetical protein